MNIKFFSNSIYAGFPHTVSSDIEDCLDITNLIVKHPAATYFVRVSGDSMDGSGIHEGDILVVDRAKDIAFGDIVIANLNGKAFVKRLGKDMGVIKLRSDNPKYPDFEVMECDDFEIWGVVTYVIHKT